MCMKHKIYGLMCCLFLCVTMLIPSVNVYANDAGTLLFYVAGIVLSVLIIMLILSKRLSEKRERDE